MLQTAETEKSNATPQSEDTCSKTEHFDYRDGIVIERKP
jgi:hypothetical protein